MNAKNTLLRNLLLSMINEWGREEVEATLSKIARSADVGGGFQLTVGERKRRKQKPSASEQVARAEFADPKGQVMRELAGQFDRKQFLPTNADVREFLIMMGERPGAMKDRSDAFRRLLVTLSKLPDHLLWNVTNSSRHSGPSQLGPLSDAIADAAASRIRDSK